MEQFEHAPGGEANAEALEQLYGDASPEQQIALNALYGELERLRTENEELKQDALTDKLTGLPNHRAYEQYTQRLNSRIQALRHPFQEGGHERREVPPSPHFAIAIGDVNQFKPFNDTLGHTAGDTLLAHIARQYGENLRESDFFFRKGGDEFALLTLEGVTHEKVDGLRTHLQAIFDSATKTGPQAEVLIQKCLRAVGVDKEPLVRERVEALGITFGVSVFDINRHSNVEQLYIEADADMYAQKPKDEDDR